uniref:Uncharacterized protein n=1 Tax=Pinguiococcus pyrenoidosus TaxID=172671 RepID=A0A7R9YFJ6_9STRA|mmetsp:Transcript_8908/g.33633  ORF Transcript_8908/g.33633 Transcript_8908/m.33633 type:complete len:118 (+) Transcript_8908:49-402(+)
MQEARSGLPSRTSSIYIGAASPSLGGASRDEKAVDVHPRQESKRPFVLEDGKLGRIGKANARSGVRTHATCAKLGRPCLYAMNGAERGSLAALDLDLRALVARSSDLPRKEEHINAR